MDNLKAVHFVLMYDGAENGDLLLNGSIADGCAQRIDCIALESCWYFSSFSG